MERKFSEVGEELWLRVKHLLPDEPDKHRGGRPREVSDRQALAGVIYRLRTGCQWKAVPHAFGSGSTVHRRFGEWVKAGVFQRLFEVLLAYYDDVKGIEWDWAALDSAMVKAPKGGPARVRIRLTGRSWAPSAMYSRMPRASRSASA